MHLLMMIWAVLSLLYALWVLVLLSLEFLGGVQVVKRILPLVLIFVFIFVLSVPCFAYDVVQTDADMFGFSYDNSKIWLFDHTLSGYKIDVDNQIVNAQKIYFYIPCTQPVELLDFSFSLCVTGGSFLESSCDYGYIYSNSYHIESSLPVSNYQWVGTSSINGSSARVVNCKRSFSDLPFTGYSRSRYIRYCIDVDSNYSTTIDLLSYLNKNLNQGLSGTLGNASYSLSATQGDHVGTVTSGSLTESGYYITGSLKTKYYNGSSVSTNSGTLTSGTTGSGGYLWVPSHTISATASSPLKMNISGGNILGTVTPSQASQLAELQGTYLDRTYVDTVSVYATRSYDDQELVDAVNDGFDQNHADLGRIESQMQEVVDHMQGLEQQGNEINGTTSQSTINNATGIVNTGTSSMADTADYVSSGVATGYSEGQGYINFLSYGVEEMVEFGSDSKPVGVWLWAIIFIPVAFFIFRRISE